ncbi:hypothetical protein [Streptomyces litchfieldiae]|uniref:Uncharacterized protein n=1 Tax=Streptomyces litchfieldiae TaxID=3075543 RepID=A0ABU2MM45_9ACTN|nr:hypothetical protein [Streptomyces sp. DSM 44938]MDT0341993.1 hypothetical protein [Streptomyces sp. DSM 44938]
MRISVRTSITAAAAVVLALTPAGALADDGWEERKALKRELITVKAATANYHDLERAEADGYALATECVPGTGYHYLHEVAAGQEDLAVAEPNLLVYAPLPGGFRQLVAVEYASETPATLFGREFDPPNENVPYYTLHVWLWKWNPDGLFYPTNSRVSCER